MNIIAKIWAMALSLFIRDKIGFYKTLRPCFCPALQETVYFTSKGIHHLLYKNRRPRNHNDKHRRFALVPYLTVIIIKAERAIKKIVSNDPLVIQWSLLSQVKVKNGEETIKVVLEKEGTRKVEFLSVMGMKYIPRNQKSRS